MQNQVFVRFGRQLSTLSNPPVRRGVQLPIWTNGNSPLS
jgi:hypothetical protein